MGSKKTPCSPYFSLTDFLLIAMIVSPLIGYYAYFTWGEPNTYQNYDPQMPYFLDSLQIFHGNHYFYIDHPGTPVELLGSLFLGVTYPFLANTETGFTRYYIDHPDLFLKIAHGFITLMSIVCMVLFYNTAKASNQWRSMLSAAALSSMYFVIHPTSFQTLILWSHNSFNFPFGTLFLLFSFNSIKNRGEIRLYKLIGLGLVFGILSAVTIYFVVWVIGGTVTIIVYYQIQSLGWRKTLVAALVMLVFSLLGFTLGVIPIFNQLSQFFPWVERLLIHQGIYGSGATGITSLTVISANLSSLQKDLPFIFAGVDAELVLFSYAIVRWRDRMIEAPGLWAFGVGLIFQLFFCILIVAKHPGDIYMLSVAAIIPVLMMVIMMLFENEPLNKIRIENAFIFVVLIGFVFSLPHAFQYQHQVVSYLNNNEEQTQSVIDGFAHNKGVLSSNLKILWTYGTYSRCYSLWFGNGYAGDKFRKQISDICANQYNLSIWSGEVFYIQGSARVQDVAWDILVTTRDVLENYSFMKDLGKIYKELPDSTIFIVNKR